MCRSHFILSLILASSAAAQEAPKVFRTLPWSRAPQLAPSEAARRTVPVEIESTLFDREAAAKFQPRVVEFNLFEDAALPVRLETVEHAGPRTLIWTGQVVNSQRGRLVMAVTGKIHAASLTTDDGRLFTLRYADDSVHWVQERDSAGLGPDLEPVRVLPGELPVKRAPLTEADDGSIVDVLVVYTPAARSAAGGTTAMQNLVALGIAETNQGYANSGVIQRVRLARTEEVSYTESGSFSTDLNRLRLTSDGYMDSVHTTRNTYRADVVSLWVNSGDACGLAYLLTDLGSDFATRAFNVVRRDCATGYYSFGHEMGHNMGATHDAGNSSGPGVFSYSYGFQQFAVNPFFRTVMAYACSGGVNCPRVNFWSNPGASYQGIATGTGNANNALTLNNTRNTSANWRQATTAISISPTSASFSGSGGSGTVTVTAGAGQAWTASSNSTFLTITSGASGSGSGSVGYTVASNPTTSTRSGSLTIAGQTFTVTQSGTAITCSTTPISIPTTVNASLTASDCISPVRPGSYARRYTFSAIAGQQVAISMSSSAVDTYLFLLGPTGTVVTSDDDSGPGLDSRIPPSGFFTLPLTGIYTIEATTFDDAETGAFTLQVTTQAGCTYSISPTSRSVDHNINTGSVNVVTQTGCSWVASSNTSWISVTSQGSGTGSGATYYSVAANPGQSSRTGTMTVAGQTFTITQSGIPSGCQAGTIAMGQTVNGSLTLASCSSQARGPGFLAARYSFSGTAGQQVVITLTSPTMDTYLYLIGPSGGVVASDDDSAGNLNSRIPPSGQFVLPQSGTYVIEATTFDILETGSFSLSLTGSTAPPVVSGLRFVPMTPCRVMETRAQYNFEGRTGVFGPPFLSAGQTRTLTMSNSNVCQIPADARAYVLNVTLIPRGGVDFATLWPGGESRPNFWSIRSPDGQIVANQAIVKSGNGAIQVYVSNDADILIDISGYFADPLVGGTNLVYYPLTPCRVIETRIDYRTPPGPFGPPTMAKGQTRSFQFPATPYCQVPAGATAYSATLTVVPPQPLPFMTLWPAGGSQPNVSSINSFVGRILANNVIVPASANGSIDVYAFDRTDFIVDINGYFAPDNGQGLYYFPVTQCRANDSTVTGGIYADNTTRTVTVPGSGNCTGIPATAKGYVVNVTAMPGGSPMPFITVYPTGQARPNASVLNAFEGQTVTNATIVPAGTNGAIDVYAYRRTHAVVEISGYFGR